MNNLKSLQVKFNDKTVGTLAITRENVVAFEYSSEWLDSRNSESFSISPLSLPLEKKVFIPKFDPFNGLFGVFNDSLPDGWGRLVLDRFLLKNNIDPSTVNNLNRLTLIDDNAMGGLTYEPMQKYETPEPQLDLDKIAKECESILKTDQCDNLDEIFKLGGSSGGTRPKILTKIDGEDWIIKFPSSLDDKNAGELEYKYSLCAKDCGLEMAETILLSSEICSGYFGTKRFDREYFKNRDLKIHMVSVSGLLETTHRLPNLDYNTLMKLTLKITNSFEEVEKMFRLMCFNVFAHNRDDHSKNFAFLYVDGGWVLSPAYDLTRSYSINGEHATTINGEGKNPTIADIMSVAKNIGLKEKTAQKIALYIKNKVEQANLLKIK